MFGIIYILKLYLECLCMLRKIIIDASIDFVIVQRIHKGNIKE